MVLGFYRRVACALRISAIIGASLFAGPLASEVKYDVLSFDQLEGWADDDHTAAFETFLNTCNNMKGADWKGAQRADVFFGTGDEAGRKAVTLRDPGRLVVLMPIQRAYALLPESAI